MSGKPITLPGRHVINIALALALLVSIYAFYEGQSQIAFWLIAGVSFLLGVLIIIPIGGADMPVVISMLNSYSGWAAAGIGFTLGNSALIITGALVGSSGAILSYIMCHAMHRSFISVILGGFGGEVAGPGAGAEQRPVKLGSAEDAAYIMKNAQKVIIVPGYGMAVAQAQHALREMADKLKAEGVEVKYAIHPVAGRMPGHMNVLLAEANVPYDEVFELEDINSEFAQADIAFVIGANDVTNPAAEEDQDLADLRHAGAASVEGRHRDVHQTLAGVRLCGHRQSAVLPRQHHDVAWRCQENDGIDRQIAVTSSVMSENSSSKPPAPIRARRWSPPPSSSTRRQAPALPFRLAADRHPGRGRCGRADLFGLARSFRAAGMRFRERQAHADRRAHRDGSRTGALRSA